MHGGNVPYDALWFQYLSASEPVTLLRRVACRRRDPMNRTEVPGNGVFQVILRWIGCVARYPVDEPLAPVSGLAGLNALSSVLDVKVLELTRHALSWRFFKPTLRL